MIAPINAKKTIQNDGQAILKHWDKASAQWIPWIQQVYEQFSPISRQSYRAIGGSKLALISEAYQFLTFPMNK